MSDIVERAARFATNHVAPNAARWAREGHIATDGLKAAAAEGLLAVEVPRAWGGAEARFRDKLQVLEVLSRHSYDFAFSMINTGNVAARLAVHMSPEVAKRYVPDLIKGERFGGTALSEPDAGSDFAAIKTRAVKHGDDWVLDGEKAWITNAAIADVFITYAQTDAKLGWRGVACFLVDGLREGFARAPVERLAGGGATGVGGFKLSNYRVRADEVMAPPGEGFKRAMAGVNQARTYVAAMCCAMVDACLDTAIAYGRKRQAFGGPLTAKQGWRWMAGDIATDAEAARLLVAKAADLIERDADAALAAAHAKKFAARMAVLRISDACQLMGAAGLREDYPFLRHLASARVASYTDGSTEMQNERIAAIIVGQ